MGRNGADGPKLYEVICMFWRMGLVPVLLSPDVPDYLGFRPNARHSQCHGPGTGPDKPKSCPDLCLVLCAWVGPVFSPSTWAFSTSLSL